MFMTDRLRATMRSWAQAENATLEETEEGRRADIPARRFGDPSEFGEACAFLCGRQAGYMTGLNLLIDGGLYPGTF